MRAPHIYHPGAPDVSAEERLLLMNASDWEVFIEECVRQVMAEAGYLQVHRLGGAGDKGRDVCGYTLALPTAGSWDLYQAKHYASTLSPGDFAGELAKFLFSVFSSFYTCPRSYFLCALKVGVSLLDLVLNPEQMRSWILQEWKKKNGNFGKFKQSLTPDLENFIDVFPFEIIRALAPADLLEIHKRSAAHWPRFGILAKRGPNPDVPETLTVDEMTYVSALLEVYGEHVSDVVGAPAGIPASLQKHFKVQRRLFYSAEGLNRFSRDKLPGAFDDLLDQLDLGVGTVVSAPHPSGMSRLQQTLAAANTLQISINPLNARLEAGDLQGGCHHLVNQERICWVDAHDD